MRLRLLISSPDAPGVARVFHVEIPDELGASGEGFEESVRRAAASFERTLLNSLAWSQRREARPARGTPEAMGALRRAASVSNIRRA